MIEEIKSAIKKLAKKLHMEGSGAHLCYCQVPEGLLRQIARLRFIDKIPTEEIMKRVSTKKEREYVAVVALLDVKPEQLKEVSGVKDPLLLRHLLDCRDHVCHILHEAGIEIEDRIS